MFAANPPTDESVAPCLECGVSVPAGTLSCPSCDYDVTEHNRWRFTLGAIGTALTLTVVLAPLGLPLLWAASRHRERAAGSVTASPPGSLGSHLQAVLRHHLSPAAPGRPRGDFTRGAAAGANRPPEL